MVVRRTLMKVVTHTGCLAVLEGGYNHQVLGQSVLAFIRGLQGL
jgi:acetoin utilization deacetylase AcuC-like enzyme